MRPHPSYIMEKTRLVEERDPRTSDTSHPDANLDCDMAPRTGKMTEKKVCNAAKMFEGGTDEDPKFLLLQIPETLPIDARHFMNSSADGGGRRGEKRGRIQHCQDDGGDVSASTRGCRLKDIPSNTKIGKLLIYDDGSAQMKIGDVLFDIEEGSSINVSHELLAMNIPEGRCTSLGGVYQKATMIPDISSILNLKRSDIS